MSTKTRLSLAHKGFYEESSAWKLGVSLTCFFSCVWDIYDPIITHTYIYGLGLTDGTEKVQSFHFSRDLNLTSIKWPQPENTNRTLQKMMNSYFEQSGFYGTPSATDPNNYRFPIGLGMSPYSQHHQTRAPQDSPYDATAAACKLYGASSLQDSQQQYKLDCKDQANGYSKEISGSSGSGGGPTGGGGGWQTSSGGSGSTGSSTGVPVRPAVCTPDGRYATPGHPSVEPTSPSRSLTSWNATCSLNNGVVSSQAASQLQQSANHTFYPWMAIAGQSFIGTTRISFFFRFLFSLLYLYS